MIKQIFIIVIILITVKLFALNDENFEKITDLNFQETKTFKLVRDEKTKNLLLIDKTKYKKIIITESTFPFLFDLYKNGNVIYIEKTNNSAKLFCYNYINNTHKLLKTPNDYDPDSPAFIAENKIFFNITDILSTDPYPGYLYLYDLEKNIYTKLTDDLTFPRISYKDYIIYCLDRGKANDSRDYFIINTNTFQKIKISTTYPGNVRKIIIENNIIKLLDENKNEITVNLDDFIKEHFTETSITTSTEHPNKANRYSKSNLTDKNPQTAWVAGGSNKGINEKITIKFNEKKQVKAVKILNGYQLNDNTFQNNNRVKVFYVIFNGKETKIEIIDSKDWQTIPINAESDTIDLVILDIYSGAKYLDDTCVSEIEVE